MLFVMDKASPHYKSKKVLKYFEENKETLTPIYLPTASPELWYGRDMEYCKTRSSILKYIHLLQI